MHSKRDCFCSLFIIGNCISLVGSGEISLDLLKANSFSAKCEVNQPLALLQLQVAGDLRHRDYINASNFLSCF